MTHSIIIANEFIKRAFSEKKYLTQMQLQKLVYISHGWSLAIYNCPLTNDAIEAWDYGPVYPELWRVLRKYGKDDVDRTIKFSSDENDTTTKGLSDRHKALLDKMFEIYGDYHAFQLSALTHQDDTPWYKVFIENKEKKGLIPNELIKEHFIQIGNS